MNVPVKTFLQKAKKLFTSKGFLFLVNGFLLASLIYFYSEDNYEKQLFKAIAVNIENGLPITDPARHDSILVRSLDICHRLLKKRTSIFGNSDLKGFNADILQPVTFDLMTGKGACGSNAHVLGRLLQEFNIDIRFPQMKVDGSYGGHILLEAKIADGWKVLDPLYNLSFKRPDGRLASFKDVQNNWDYYKQQVPQGYNMSNKYDDAVYTNWNKIPVVMPLLKQILYLVRGKEATDNYSLRSLVLRKYDLAFKGTLLIYILLVVYTIRISTRKKKQILIKEEEHKIKTKKPMLAEVYN